MSDSTDDIKLEDVEGKDIIDLIGGKDLSEDEKVELYTKMLSTIRLRVMDLFDASLSDEEQKAFANLLATGTEDDLNKFYEEKNFDVPQVMAEEALKYKAELLAYVKSIKNAGNAQADLKVALGI